MENENVVSTDASTKTVVEDKKVEASQPDETSLLLKAKEEEIQKLQKERDMFKSGMFKYKKLVKQDQPDEDDTDDEITPEEKMRQIVKQELAESELARAVAEKEAIIAKALKENAELKIAMKNRSQISNLPGGSSQDTVEISKDFFTPEQLEYFKQREKELGVKIDLKKAAENMAKLKK